MSTAIKERRAPGNRLAGSTHDDRIPELLKPMMRPGARLIDSVDGAVFWTEERDCSGALIQMVRVIFGTFLMVRLGPFESKAEARRCFEALWNQLYGDVWDCINMIAQKLEVKLNDEF